MRIQFFVPTYIPFYNAGSEWYVHGLATRLVKRGHEVSVVGTICPLDRCQARTIDGVNCHYTSDVKQARKLAQQYEPDIVFSQFDVLTYSMLKNKAEWGCKVGVILHHFDAFEKLVASGQHKSVDLFIANTRLLRLKTLELNAAIHCIDLWPPIVKERVLAEKTGNAIMLINLLPDKGVEIFFKLAENNPDKEFVGIIGGYKKLNQVKKSRLKNVSIFENIKEVSRYYEKAKILLMPSKIESFGMVGVEAQLNGIPVIAADLPELHESLGDGAVFCREYSDYQKAIEFVETRYESMSVFAKQNADEKMRIIEEQVDAFELACKEICA